MTPEIATQPMIPEEIAAEVGRIASDRKALEVIALDLRGMIDYTDYFVICTGRTERQTKAIHDAIYIGMKSAHGRLPERVVSLARVAVAERPGTARAEVERVLDHLGGAERGRFFDMPEIGISSTMLRDRVRAGIPTRYLMPDAVRSYIERHYLYRGSLQ